MNIDPFVTFIVNVSTGDTITFSDLSIATFLQWDSTNKFYDCINGVQFAVTSDSSDSTFSDDVVLQLITDQLDVNPFQIQTVLPQLSENDPFEYRVASKNEEQTCEIVNAVEDPEFRDKLASELGIRFLGVQITTLATGQSCAGSNDNTDDSGTYELGSKIALFSFLVAVFVNFTLL